MNVIDLGLTDKGVLLLGGGRGMAESCALLLAEAGCNIAVADIDFEQAERLAALVAEKGRLSLALALDVNDDSAVADAVVRAEKELSDLYGLVTIVGGTAGWTPILDMTGDQWDHDFGLNLRYFFRHGPGKSHGLLIRRESPGSIVCVSSIDGFRAAGYHAGYGASKAGMISLVKTMCAEWGPHRSGQLRGARIDDHPFHSRHRGRRRATPRRCHSGAGEPRMRSPKRCCFSCRTWAAM